MKFTKLALAAALGSALMALSLAVSAADSKRDLIQRLPTLQKNALETLGNEMTRASANPLLNQANDLMLQAVPPEKREATVKEINAELGKYMEAASPIVKSSANKMAMSTLSPMFESNFSEEELKQLLAALEAPALKKYQAMLPEIQKALVDKISADARPQVEPKMKALQESMAKILDYASGGKLSQAIAAQKAAAASAAASTAPKATPKAAAKK